MIKPTSTLAAKTLNYWRVSKSYNGQSKERMPFAKASRLLMEVITTIPMSKKVSVTAYILHQELIEGTEPLENQQTNQ